ncbi:PhnD/SsuA/transferrin family substrate-binding protein [Neptunicella sp. SCSIO 80796]|uniref:PhnD/SsuA/transferrin family substrate-binding protein n=1 Tax=Neptunicella plasticusilytica TaxID=3117012 RepID=UPI003A4D8216
MSLDRPVPQLKPVIHHFAACDTQTSNSQQELIVYINAELAARQLANSLCANPVVAKQFGKVRVFWNSGENQVLQFVGKGIADLALVKQNMMDAIKAESTYGYEEVASYPDYSAYLIAMREKPQITKEYLLGKRLGLLDYPTSRSGHIIPIRMLKSLNLSPDTMQITYANSHSELRHLLTSGQVDIISSYWQQNDETTLLKNYITPIEERIHGSKWYMKMETRNVDLYCAVQDVLVDIATQQANGYFSQLKLVPECPGRKNAAIN